MLFWYINICWAPMEELKSSPFRHVNAQKIMFDPYICKQYHLDRVKRIWYLSPIRAAKVQASLRIRAVSPEPPLLAHTSIESRWTFRQKARSLAPLIGRACAVKICHDGMFEDTNSLDGAHTMFCIKKQLRHGTTTTLKFTSSWVESGAKILSNENIFFPCWGCTHIISWSVGNLRQLSALSSFLARQNTRILPLSSCSCKESQTKLVLHLL